VTVALAVFPPAVAEIKLVPGETAVIIPVFGAIVATAGLLLDHEMVSPPETVRLCPDASRSIANACVV
jgi:hypothetical protein